MGSLTGSPLLQLPTFSTTNPNLHYVEDQNRGSSSIEKTELHLFMWVWVWVSESAAEVRGQAVGVGPFIFATWGPGMDLRVSGSTASTLPAEPSRPAFCNSHSLEAG